jgi:hypothetical protein
MTDSGRRSQSGSSSLTAAHQRYVQAARVELTQQTRMYGRQELWRALGNDYSTDEKFGVRSAIKRTMWV